jgi:hypothetical protein
MNKYKIKLNKEWIVFADDEEDAKAEFFETIVNDHQMDAATLLYECIKVEKVDDNVADCTKNKN